MYNWIMSIHIADSKCVNLMWNSLGVVFVMYMFLVSAGSLDNIYRSPKYTSKFV